MSTCFFPESWSKWREIWHRWSFPEPLFFKYLSNTHEKICLWKKVREALPRTTSKEACGTEVRPNLELQGSIFKSKTLEINQDKVLLDLMRSVDEFFFLGPEIAEAAQMLRTFKEWEILSGPGNQDGTLLLRCGYTMSGQINYCVVGE